MAHATAYSGELQTPIQHVVFLLKENRSFDEYFGTFPGADGATSGQISTGQVVPLTQTPDPVPEDIDHSPGAWQTAYDNGKMDGFNLEGGAVGTDGTPYAMSQMTQDQIPNYWQYAQTYGLGDRFFAGYKGASLSNMMMVFAAQSGEYDAANGNRSIQNIPVDPVRRWNPSAWGCDDGPDVAAAMVPVPGTTISTMFPCFDFPSLPEIMSQYGVTWRLYAGQTMFHDALDALQGVRFNPTLWANIHPLSDYETDAQNGTLPDVSFVIGNQTEHPPQESCDGENETVKYVDDLMNGPDWSSSAVIEFWDEWGGFYDHVPPPAPGPGISAQISYGFRVPLLVISPFVKTDPTTPDGGYISHSFYSQESVPKFIESNWNLPNLTARDAPASPAGNFMDFFDFSGPTKPAIVLSQRTCPAMTATEQALAATEDPD